MKSIAKTSQVHVGRELRNLRRQAGLTTRVVAEMLELSRTSYENFEYRRRRPHLPLDMVARLALALRPYDVDPEAIWRLADSMELDIFARAWNTTGRRPVLRGVRKRRKKETRERRTTIEDLAGQSSDRSVTHQRRLAFARNIRRLRASKAWLQKDLAAHIHIKLITVGGWERSGHIPSDVTLRRLAEAFGCSVEALFEMAPKVAPVDRTAEAIAVAVMGLIESGTIRSLPRSGYTVRRGRGRVVVESSE